MADAPGRDRFDDWFDEPEPADAWSTRVDRIARARQRTGDAEPAEDDWLRDTRPHPSRTRRRPRRPPTRLLAVAALLLCVLFGILAAVGVFSSSSPTKAGTTVARPPTTTAPAPTTTQAAGPPVPTATLKPGDSGPSVSRLQRALAAAGFSTGGVDGSYGPATKDAVARFQRAHRLAADGVAGPKTLAALRAALASG